MPSLIVQIFPGPKTRSYPTAYVVDDEGKRHTIPAVEVTADHSTMVVTFWRYPPNSGVTWSELGRLVDLVQSCGAKVQWRDPQPHLRVVDQTGETQR